MSGPFLRARSLMTPAPVEVHPDEPSLSALRRLLDAGQSAAPVVDAAGRLVGLLSELDGIRVLNRAWVEAIPAPSVSDVMTRELVVARPATPALTLAAWFEQHRFHQVPVVGEDGSLAGVVTRRRVLAAVLDALEPAAVARERGLYLSATKDCAPARLEAGRER